MNARRSYAKITYEGQEITGDISEYFKSISYTDNLDKGDSITISLNGDKWIDDWAVLKGDKVEVELGVSDWNNEGDNRTLRCGSFTVDDISFSGPPDITDISGTSIDITKTFKSVKKDNTWENVSLEEVLQDIASADGFNSFYDLEESFIYEKIDQVKESDASLLDRLSKENGASLKVTDGKIVIFDDSKYEKNETIAEFDKANLKSNYSLECDDLSVYDSCEVTFYDPILGEELKGSFEAPASEFYKAKTGKILYQNIDTGVTGSSKAEKEKFLEDRAKKLLRAKNKNETKIKLSVMGDLNYLAGMTMKITGFGRYSGTYLMTSVTHTVDKAYRCSIEGRRRIDF